MTAVKSENNRIDQLKKDPVIRAFLIGDTVLSWMMIILFLLLLLYGAHTIWYTWSVERGSFVSDEMLEYKPVGKNYSLNEMKEINEDVVAWLTVSKTNIDYPVVQGETDMEYLNKNAFGEFSLAGSVFLSSGNSPDFTDSYNILYGHDVEGGAMFSDVLKFTDADYFNERKKGILRIPGRSWKLAIFACIEANGRDESIYGNPQLVKESGLPLLIENVKKKAVHYRNIEIRPDDQILAMSTCKEASSDDRVLIYARMIPMSEEEMANEEKEVKKRGIREKGASGWFEGLIERNPWLLPGAGACLLLLLIYAIWRKLRNRRTGRKRYLD